MSSVPQFKGGLATHSNRGVPLTQLWQAAWKEKATADDTKPGIPNDSTHTADFSADAYRKEREAEDAQRKLDALADRERGGEGVNEDGGRDDTDAENGSVDTGDGQTEQTSPRREAPAVEVKKVRSFAAYEWLFPLALWITNS